MALPGIKLPNPIKGLTNAGRDLVEGVKDRVEDVVERVVPVLDKATDVLGDGLEGAGRALSTRDGAPLPALNPMTWVGKGLEFVGNAVRDPVEKLQAFGEEFGDLIAVARQLPNALDVNDQVESLEPGESIRAYLGLEVDGATLAGQVNGLMQVRRTPAEQGGNYVVNVGGEVGFGIVAKLGSSGIGSAGVEAFVNAGGHAEFSFATREEAMAATRAIAEYAAYTAARANPIGLVASPLLNRLMGNPEQDLKAILPSLRAVELSVGADAELSGKLGWTKGGLNLGGSGQVGADIDFIGRLEFENGKPAGVALRHKTAVSGSGGASLGFKSFTGNANGYFSGQAMFEQRFDLPEDFSFGEVLREPRASFRAIQEAMIETSTSRLVLDGVATVGGNLKAKQGLAQESSGVRARVELEGNTRELMQSGAIQQALRGDFQGALATADEATVARGWVDDVTVTLKDLDYAFHGGAFGVEFEAGSIRTDVTRHRSYDEEQLEALVRDGLLRLPFGG